MDTFKKISGISDLRLAAPFFQEIHLFPKDLQDALFASIKDEQLQTVLNYLLIGHVEQDSIDALVHEYQYKLGLLLGRDIDEDNLIDIIRGLRGSLLSLDRDVPYRIKIITALPELPFIFQSLAQINENILNENEIYRYIYMLRYGVECLRKFEIQSESPDVSHVHLRSTASGRFPFKIHQGRTGSGVHAVNQSLKGSLSQHLKREHGRVDPADVKNPKDMEKLLKGATEIQVPGRGNIRLILGAGPVGLFAACKFLQKYPDDHVVLFEPRNMFTERRQMFNITPTNIIRLDEFCRFKYVLHLFNPPWRGNGTGTILKIPPRERGKFIMNLNRELDGHPVGYGLRIDDIQNGLLKYIRDYYQERFFFINGGDANIKDVYSVLEGVPKSQNEMSYTDLYMFWKEKDEKKYMKLSSDEFIEVYDASGGRGAGRATAVSLRPHDVDTFAPVEARSYGAITYLFPRDNPGAKLVADQKDPFPENQNRFRLFHDYDPQTGTYRGCYLGLQISQTEYVNNERRQREFMKELVKDAVISFAITTPLDVYIESKNFFPINVRNLGDSAKVELNLGRKRTVEIIPIGDSRRSVNFFSGSGVNYGLDDVWYAADEKPIPEVDLRFSVEVTLASDFDQSAADGSHLDIRFIRSFPTSQAQRRNSSQLVSSVRRTSSAPRSGGGGKR